MYLNDNYTKYVHKNVKISSNLGLIRIKHNLSDQVWLDYTVQNNFRFYLHNIEDHNTDMHMDKVNYLILFYNTLIIYILHPKVYVYILTAIKSE